MGFLLPILFCVAAVSVLIIFLCCNNGGGGRPPGYKNGYVCGANGCAQAKKGDYPTEKECVDSCASFVKRNGSCVKISGVPWQSYATEKLCRSM